MASWGSFATAAPVVAAKGRELFYQYGVGMGFLGTVRRDGGPRVHPICPILTDDALFALIVPGPKREDLRRDPRYALHCLTSAPPRQDDALYLAPHAHGAGGGPAFGPYSLAPARMTPASRSTSTSPPADPTSERPRRAEAKAMAEYRDGGLAAAGLRLATFLPGWGAGS